MTDFHIKGFMQWQVYPNESQINEDWDGEPLGMSTILPRAISESYAVMTEKDGEG